MRKRRKHSPLVFRFLRKSSQHRLLLIEAIFLSILTRIIISLLPFRVLTYILKADKLDYHGRVNGNNTIAEPSQIEPIEIREQIQIISDSITKVSNNAFWKATCLVQASSGMIMLKRRNINSRLYLGVTKGTDGQMKPHAWLETGGKVILGGGELEKYVVVSVFS